MQRILIVDDNEENLYYLQVLLTSAGYEVASAKNGNDALKSALSKPPDLIVSDILMPGMDGFTLCRTWRGDPNLSTIPFTFYTATYTDPKDKELGLAIGADEFLLKPLEPEEILSSIHSLLSKPSAHIVEHTIEPPNHILKEYNAALIRKLEDKLVQLEAANHKLSDAEEFIRAVLENSPLPILVATVDGMVLLTNSAFTKTFGYSPEETADKNCSDLIALPGTESEVSLLSRRIKDDDLSPQLSQRRCKDGASIEVEICLAPMRLRNTVTGLLAIYRDVTHQRKLEYQLQQSQKLEAVGQLAAGVAHDFNNLLGIILGYSDLIREAAEPGRSRHYADQIRQACSRASTLTRQLLAFSRKQVMLPQVIELEPFMEELQAMLRRVTREDIELSMSIRKPLGKIRIDPAHLEQVVINLVSNARDAMPHGGRVDIHISNEDVTQARELHYSIPVGEWVKMSVSDTGIGMDETTLSHIFEPFFTTKPVGVGTGLGLASVHGIVEQNGGIILVSSEPGKGTRFDVYFPSLKNVQVPKTVDKGSREEKGSESILIVEDEETLRALISEMLEGLGYRVLTALSAEDAVRMFKNSHEKIDLLISDVIMPQMNGRELSETALSYRPEMCVLFVSGYQAGEMSNQLGTRHRTGFLAKPFTRQQLSLAVRSILDSNKPERLLTQD